MEEKTAASLGDSDRQGDERLSHPVEKLQSDTLGATEDHVAQRRHSNGAAASTVPQSPEDGGSSVKAGLLASLEDSDLVRKGNRKCSSIELERLSEKKQDNGSCRSSTATRGNEHIKRTLASELRLKDSDSTRSLKSHSRTASPQPSVRNDLHTKHTLQTEKNPRGPIAQAPVAIPQTARSPKIRRRRETRLDVDRARMIATNANLHYGLSSDQALEKVLQVARNVLKEESRKVSVREQLLTYNARPETLLLLACAILLLITYIYSYYSDAPNQIRTTAMLVESLFLFVVYAWNGYLFQSETRLMKKEIMDRAETIVNSLERSGMNMVQDTRIPFVRTLTLCKVLRDGLVRVFPTNLLAEGDIVEMHYGDIAPCRMKLLQTPAEELPPTTFAQARTDVQTPRKEYYLAPGQIFKPTLFSGSSSEEELQANYIMRQGRFQFRLLETPIERNIRAALREERPNPVIFNELLIIIDLFYNYIVWIVLALALVILALRYGLVDVMQNHNPQQGFALLMVLPAYSLLPLLPMVFPLLWLVSRSFGNAKILILFEALQSSKTMYEDDEEVDEFDAEAPPPIKIVQIDRHALWKRFCSLLTKWDKSSLTRSTNLLESLGSTTVICCLDREGTISDPFPSVEEVMFPMPSEELAVLEVVEDLYRPGMVRFEETDWEQHMSSLKPLGLNLLLNTNCGVLHGRRRGEHHRKRSNLHFHGKTKPARQSCVCSLGKLIGFTENALKTFAKRKELFTFCPFHPSLDYAVRNYQYEIPSMVSSVYEEMSSGSYQLFTDGHVELLLDMCSDYWTGQGLESMTPTMEKRIYSFYHNAIINDMQCVGYAYRPINVVDHGHIPFLHQENSLPADTGYALIALPSAAGLDRIEATNADSHSYRGSLSGSENGSQTLGRTLSNASGAGSLERTWKQFDQQRVKARVNEFAFQEISSKEDEAQFFKDVIKGQIFLGMATLCHQPKLNVTDFIEDLGLAGIRFVYFSPTGERESKAYAERLGLETDWNSCILLSSSNDEDDIATTGYMQSYDINARLPRGIDQIRPHLQDVDDIPLHVSLFAECSPEATTEMIRIFQEYGEVVCCIGSALNAKSTPSFAAADVSIAMEPMQTRAQTRGSDAMSGHQPPLAIGASLVSLPCGLVMQYETSLYALTQLIRESRRLLTGMRLGFFFLAGTYMSMSLALLLSYCMLLPPLWSGYQMLWLIWIVCPIIAVPILFAPDDDNIMSIMPVKNIEHLNDRWRFMAYFFIRFTPLSILCNLTYILCLLALKPSYMHATDIFGRYGANGWLHWTSEEQWPVMVSENVMSVAFIWSLIWVCATFLHRTSSLIHYLPFRNGIWIVSSILGLVLQLVFAIVSIHFSPISISHLPWYIYFIGLIWPLSIIPIQELAKMHDRKQYIRFQKRSKLQFNTKLGMHSPL
ncbi:hypothetical protein BZG36_03847 [Bifiguratus adelaidae]|uniref:Cation-transporting P-type ATPase C-terminal domain-containing protein n=1 Tax=Bifiguratus adelaidae TaxID=1938954 RepID=A0A261XWI4_9FUNG|nr:hypothetical protein BZG36_03847 [Bifiguratus adelaidae]